jgi:pimeloyl-ACP methyl ester carboxylesterase
MRRWFVSWRWTATIIVSAVAATASAQTSSARIDQATFVPIGGIEQWISIRGDDRANPVLLVVHGGPGEVQWPQAEVYQPWEKAFTLVQWDQRGAGHTFGRLGTKTPDVTLDRISRDGVELAEYLCRNLGKKKIIVLGHSWRSIVATRMVQMRPSLFAAYVGTGQVTTWAAMVNTQYDLVLAKARTNGDQTAIKQIEADRPDPANARQYFNFSSKYQVRSLWPQSDQAWLKHLRSQLPDLQARDPEQSKYLEEGMMFQGEHVLSDQLATNLPKTACDINIAYFVIQGQDDIVTPTPAVVEYFKCVKAPKKELILIANAGHFAFMSASDKFLEALTSKVRPIALENGS